MVPSLDVEVESVWAGTIDTTPDQAPVIDEVGPRGFFLAAGFSGHGLCARAGRRGAGQSVGTG